MRGLWMPTKPFSKNLSIVTESFDPKSVQFTEVSLYSLFKYSNTMLTSGFDKWSIECLGTLDFDGHPLDNRFPNRSS